jgi:hypothetical protein
MRRPYVDGRWVQGDPRPRPQPEPLPLSARPGGCRVTPAPKTTAASTWANEALPFIIT